MVRFWNIPLISVVFLWNHENYFGILKLFLYLIHQCFDYIISLGMNVKNVLLSICVQQFTFMIEDRLHFLIVAVD